MIGDDQFHRSGIDASKICFEITETAALEGILERFGELQPSTAGVAVRLDGKGGLADVVRALDSADVTVAALNLHAPTLDDVFLAKTGRSLEGAEEEEPSEPEPAPA
jgi:ABC-2 type transport system ATP-binding protein